MRNKTSISLLMSAWFLLSCGSDAYNPKPKGYPRIDFPKKEYRLFKGNCPFVFEIPYYAAVGPDESGEYCWFNIDVPFLKSRIHFSYKVIDGNLNKYLEDARTLVYKHTIRASAINEREFINKEARVYARIYELEGNAASSVQFYATDSTRHFIRGALYFNAQTNVDSLRPAIEFIRQDVVRMVESLKWNEVSSD
ncbi:MAG: gliding motility lipoprotein GldD [Vicingaceae bacterium]